MRQTMTGGIVVSVVLMAGAALAQSSRPSMGPASRGLVPVTGPSAVGVVEPAPPELTPVLAQGDTRQSVRTFTPSAASATTARPAPHAMKAASKPAGKVTPKKGTLTRTSATKHVAKGAGTHKTRHVATTKQQPTGHHTAVSKPIPLTKSLAPAKGSGPAQPVLPRV